MPETGSDGVKDVFFSHENIVRKDTSFAPFQSKFVNGVLNDLYVGIDTQSTLMSVRKEIDKPKEHIANFQ
jgi:hypothetical protein